jgi:hypothetical protein
LRKHSEEFGCKKPELITGTNLRKYLATTVQVMNLAENEMDWLARHLGHDLNVHREFYRQHESAIEIAKISRLLLSSEKGEIHKYSGKKLVDIPVEGVFESDEDSSEEEQDNQEEEIDDSVVPRRKVGQPIKKKDGSESAAVLAYFKELIKEDRLPRQNESQEYIKTTKSKLTIRNVKDIVYAQLQKLRRAKRNH